MITIETQHPKRRAVLPFHNHLIPIASTLFPDKPHNLQKWIFDSLNSHVTQIVGWGIHMSHDSRWTSYMSPMPTEIKQRFFRMADRDPNSFHVFLCDEFFTKIHTDIPKREHPGRAAYKDPIKKLWESLTREQRTALQENKHVRINSFERFRTKVLLELRSLTEHESECRRIGLTYETQRDRRG